MWLTSNNPACRRTEDRLPAGTLTLAGAFLAAHRAELLELVREANPRRPRSLAPAIPNDLERIVLKAMARQLLGRQQYRQLVMQSASVAREQVRQIDVER